MDLNLERICLNLFQSWFKLMITTMINMRLQEFDNGVLQFQYVFPSSIH
jgi:hypothetical protein